MREVPAVALSLLVLLGAVAVAVPAVVAGPAPTEDAEPASLAAPSGQGAASVGAPTENDSSMGSEVASFMQSTSGETGEEVEAGMWTAAYENASNRSAVVQRRAGSIENRLAQLQDRKERLVAARENGSIGAVEYQSRMSRIVGQMAALNRSIDETERQARETGVNSSVVSRLREQVRNLSGPEVAEAARSMAGGPPTDAPANRAGPPGEQGPPNGTEGPPGEQGPPNGTDGAPNGTEGPGGPPDGSGNGGGGGADGGQDNGSGQGNDDGQGNDGGQG
jgi:hypothetical protein